MIKKDEYFSIIIPTMWVSQNIKKMLPLYNNSEYVKEIIIIDNDPSKKIDLKNLNKVIYYTEGKNIFVNPSWNKGVSLAKHKILLVNDDILISDLNSILIELNKTDFDIVGVKFGEKNGDINIEKIEQFAHSGYGSFMYVNNYVYIPEQIKIWYGDNILFDHNKKRGVLVNSTITNNSSETVKIFKQNNNQILLDDKKFYDNIKNSGEINVVIRTSNRPNYFKTCVNSVFNFLPNAKIHVTIDDIKDLTYINENLKDKNFSYYLIDKNTVENIVSTKKITRQKFIYNYYFNIVKPFLNGWVLYLDDDDMLISKPNFDMSDKKSVNLFRTSINGRIVPSNFNFRKTPILNDISTLCVILHSENLIDWIPNRGGDYDFISSLYKKNKIIWHDKIISSTQTGGNFGNRKDISQIYDGFYLNLKKRTDRKEKMEVELKKTYHNIKRYEAVDGDTLKSTNNFKGSIKNSHHKQYATYLSHLGILKKALDSKSEYIIILEDDVTLCNDFDYRLQIFINNMPKDWVIGYIGFNEQPSTVKTKITENIFKIKNVYGCFGMVIKKSFLPTLISVIENQPKTVDEVIREKIQPNYPCYGFIPFLLYVNDDYSDIFQKNRVLQHIKKYFSPYLPYNIDKFKIVTVSTFWNAENFVKECIQSLKNQTHKNFISYFIDDMSTDKSYEIAKTAIANDSRFVLIKNNEKKFKTKNFIDVIKNNININQEDVIVEIDGDDKLADEKVLDRIYNVFKNDNIWLCGTKWKDRSGRLGNYKKPDPEKARSTSWNFSHMRSFRAFLFRQIKDEHLKYNGEYFKGACDIGHAIPMLEMSGSEHFHYIDEPLYIYTWHSNQSYSENGGIGDKTTQSKTGGYIYRLPKYEKLTTIPQLEIKLDEKIIKKENKKDYKKEALEKIGFNNKGRKTTPKPINYEKINLLQQKQKATVKPSPQKPIREHKPNKRQELNDLKKGDISKQVRHITGGKPNRRNNLPNIF